MWSPGTLRRAGLVAFGLLLLLSTLWDLATPLGSSADENEHIVRAALVVRGQLTGTPPPGPRTPFLDVTAPRTYAAAIHEPFCFVFDQRIPAGCAPRFPSSTAPMRTAIYVGRYQPTYYLLVGLPTLAFSNPLGMYAVRILSSVLIDALLAWAIAVALALGGHLLFGGVLIATTPMVLYLSATISTSSLEVAAAIGFWTALTLLVRVARPPRHLVVGAGVCGVLLVLARPPSPLWALLAVIVAICGLNALRLRALLRRLDVLVAGSAVALAAVASVAWTLVEHATEVLPGATPAAHASNASIVRASIGDATGYVRQAVGTFSLDVPTLTVIVLAWVSMASTLGWLAWSRGDRRGRVVLVVAIALAAIVPTITVALAARSHGYIGYGRYFLPAYVGVPIVAATIGSGDPELDVRLLRGLVIVVGAGQALAFVWCLHRFLVGSAGPVTPWSHVPGGWSPPLPGTVLDVMFVAAVGISILVVRRTVTDGRRRA